MNVEDHYCAAGSINVNNRPPTPPAPYVPMTGFGQALSAMQSGNKVTRAGWNGQQLEELYGHGQGMWIALQIPDEYSKMTLPYFYMKTIQGDRVPWVASNTDLFATDWMVVL